MSFCDKDFILKKEKDERRIILNLIIILQFIYLQKEF